MAREPSRGRGAPANSERGRRERGQRATEELFKKDFQEVQRENNRFQFGDEAKSSFQEWIASDRGQAALERETGTGGGGRAALQRRQRARARLEKAYVDAYSDRRGQLQLESLGSNEERRRGDGSGGGGGSGSGNPPPPPPAPSKYEEVELRVQSNIDNRSFQSRRSAGASFNIQQFRENVVNGVLPTHSFLVVFSRMNWVSARAQQEAIERDLTMRCENAILPTLGLLQQDNLRRYGYGPIENVPYGYNMGDFTLQFLIDKDARIVNFFESWTNFIVNRDSFGGANMSASSNAIQAPYELAFKDDYVCPSVNVFVYDRSQNLVFEYNIYDAYPNSIQSMNLSWSDENQLMRLNVGFAFTDMRLKTVYDPQGGNQGGAPLDNLRDLSMLLNRNISDIGISAIDPSFNVPTINLGVADTTNQPISVGDNNTPLVTQPAVIETFTQPSLAVELPYDEVTIASPQNFE